MLDLVLPLKRGLSYLFNVGPQASQRFINEMHGTGAQDAGFGIEAANDGYHSAGIDNISVQAEFHCNLLSILSNKNSGALSDLSNDAGDMEDLSMAGHKHDADRNGRIVLVADHDSDPVALGDIVQGGAVVFGRSILGIARHGNVNLTILGLHQKPVLCNGDDLSEQPALAVAGRGGASRHNQQSNQREQCQGKFCSLISLHGPSPVQTRRYRM